MCVCACVCVDMRACARPPTMLTMNGRVLKRKHSKGTETNERKARVGVREKKRLKQVKTPSPGTRQEECWQKQPQEANIGASLGREWRLGVRARLRSPSVAVALIEGLRGAKQGTDAKQRRCGSREAQGAGPLSRRFCWNLSQLWAFLLVLITSGRASQTLTKPIIVCWARLDLSRR
eukprot:3294113-Pleurochrysis_carterae.AAC.1